MHTVLLLSKPIDNYKKVITESLSKEIAQSETAQDRLDFLLDQYNQIVKLDTSSTLGNVVTSKGLRVQVLQPDLEYMELAIQRRQKMLQDGSDEEKTHVDQKYKDVFSKDERDVQDFSYKIPELFSLLGVQKIKDMLMVKLSNSYEYPNHNDIYKATLYFGWNNDEAKYSLLKSVKGVEALSFLPFESFAVPFRLLTRGFLEVKICTNNFYSIQKHIPHFENGVLKIKRKTLFSSRMIVMPDKLMSKDRPFLQPVIKEALIQLDKYFVIHNIYFDKLRCA